MKTLLACIATGVFTFFVTFTVMTNTLKEAVSVAEECIDIANEALDQRDECRRQLPSKGSVAQSD